MKLNKVFVLGNLTRDPELRATSAGQSVGSFTVATDHIFTDKAGKKQQQAEFHHIIVWGKLAEISKQYLRKGSLVLVEGHLQTRNWEDDTGVHYKTEVVAEGVQFGPKTGKKTEAEVEMLAAAAAEVAPPAAPVAA